ncbi:MAG TPA: MliC family protein [Candidatus Paceibacterota bacterium]|nr:MliC family protein [Candidatus Paceibacterota bacterium]
MNRTQLTVAGVLIVIIIAAVAWAYANPAAAPTASQQTSRTLVATAAYQCDNAKTITAAYYDGGPAPAAQEGQPPTPTGSVDVSLNGGATSTLAQTISADGARYANADESFVFWSKGNTALVMNNNAMDLDYTNCAVGTSTSAQ